MKTYSLMKEVRRLAAVKAKNEQAVPEEELRGRYRAAYEGLCGNLKEKQCELRVRYMDAVQKLREVMAESVYLEPGAEEEQLHEIMLDKAAESEGDALAKTLLLAFWCFYTEEVEESRKEKTDAV